MQALHKCKADFFSPPRIRKSHIKKIRKLVTIIKVHSSEAFSWDKAHPFEWFQNSNATAENGCFNNTLCYKGKCHDLRSQYRNVFQDWTAPSPPHFGGQVRVKCQPEGLSHSERWMAHVESSDFDLRLCLNLTLACIGSRERKAT